MHIIKRKVSKTFLNILVYLSTALFIIIIVLSNILYYNFEKNELRNIYETNKRNLSGLAYNINYINEMVKTFCISQFYEPNNYKIINVDKHNDADINQAVDALKVGVLSNLQVHSAVIYNSNLKEYYSTFGNDKYIRDADLVNIIEKRKGVPLLYPVPRILPDETYQNATEVFTYFMYDAINKNSMVQGALIVNVKINWLFETLMRLKSEYADLIIINRQGQVIWDEYEKIGMFHSWNPGYAQKILDSKELGNIFIHQGYNEKRVITYLSIPNTGWIMVNDEPYEEVFNSLIRIKKNFIIITLLFLFLSMALSIFISTALYKPFNNLVQIIKEKFNNYLYLNDTRDDIQYINQAFHITSNQLMDLEDLKQSVQDILKDNVFKSMLLESNIVNKEMMKQYFEHFNDLFGSKSKFLMVVFKINNYKFFMKLSESDRKLYKYGIQNIANEIITACCKVETIDMGNDELVAILDITEFDTELDEIIVKEIISIQHHVEKALNISLTAFVSRVITDFPHIYKYYREIKNIEKNRIFFDGSCIINIQTFYQQTLSKDFSYPYDVEERLINQLKKGNLKLVTEQYLQYIDLISKNGFDNFMVCLMNLTVSINKVVNEINNVCTQDIDVDFFDFYINLIKLDSLKQINEHYLDILKMIIERKTIKKENKHNYVINAIKDFIELNYCSKNLNIEQIALDFKMSKVYLGKIFKEYTQKSLAQYINEVRLKKAAQLLAIKRYSIGEILDQVGFQNESTFYKLFKKYYGVTPSEYRTNININKILENTNVL